MATTKIEWSEKVWNPVTGCTKVSTGCKHCYAEKMAYRLQGMGQAKYVNGFEVTLHPEVLEKPLMWRKPSRVFVNSMSDLFHEEVPKKFIRKVFKVMGEGGHHQFQVLTKRSERMAELAPDLPWADNIWMGVTVEKGKYLHRIDHLRDTPAATKFISFEPLLGPVSDSDPAVMDLGGEQVPTLPQEVQKWLETPMPNDRSAHDYKLAMLCLENGIFNRKALAGIISSNSNGKASSRKDPDKYVAEVITKAEAKFDAKIRRYTARKLAKMEFPEAHGIIGKGVLSPGTGMIIVGETSVGKSLLTSEMGLDLRTGQPFLGIPTARIDSVLLIQAEIRPEMVKERLASQVKGMGLKKSPKRIFLTDPRDSYDLMNPKDLARILWLIRRTKAEVVIIDPISCYHHADENNNSEMRKFLGAIDQIKGKTGAAVVLVHHFSKSTDKKGKHRIRGATTISDWADTVIELSAGVPANQLKAKFLKLRNGAPLQDIHLKRNDNFIHEVVEDKAKCPPEKVKEILESEFNGQCKQQKDLVEKLAKETGSSEKTVRAGIKLAVKRGVIQETKTNGKSKGYKVGKQG